MRSRFTLRSAPLIAASSLGLVVLLSGSARAQGEAPATQSEAFPPPKVQHREDWMAPAGLQLGLRTGYALGSGVVYSGLPVTRGTDGYLPIILDVGIRMLPEFYLGAYGQFGFVTNKGDVTTCPTGFGCTTQNWRFGIAADYHFMPRLRWDPYIGINFGYEVLHESLEGTTAVPVAPGVNVPANVSVDVTDRGWEYIGFTLGSDYRLSRYAAIGGFLSASLNQYNVHSGTQTAVVAGQSVTTPLPEVNHGMHEIYIIGLRGTFDAPFGGGSAREVAHR
jgi:hypothetical protein